MSSNEETLRRQCNVQLPEELVEELKAEAHRLTGHRRRGFSDLITILVRHGWSAYQHGELTVERRPKTVTYQLVEQREA